jgi:partner of Y14 and mago
VALNQVFSASTGASPAFSTYLRLNMSSPTPSDAKSTASKSGIITDSNGVSHIPSSVRADGSVRKEIRIRPGYRPPEDVEVYRNRAAEAWRNRGSGAGVIPGADKAPKVTAKDEKESDSKGKNAKRREARKRAAAAKAEKDDEPADDTSTVADAADEKTEEAKQQEQIDSDAEKQKEAKKLLKKLRQARDLKDKKDQGAALLPEQFEKVIRINELIRQLDGLGFDSNGEKKEDQQDT